MSVFCQTWSLTYLSSSPSFETFVPNLECRYHEDTQILFAPVLELVTVAQYSYSYSGIVMALSSCVSVSVVVQERAQFSVEMLWCLIMLYS